MTYVDFVNEDRFDEMEALSKSLFGAEEDELVDKIASFFEREANWKALKNCWLENDKSDDLRRLLRKAIKELFYSERRKSWSVRLIL